MSDQRRRRWADVVQMLYKCFVFAGVVTYESWHTVDAIPRDNDVPMLSTGNIDFSDMEAELTLPNVQVHCKLC